MSNETQIFLIGFLCGIIFVLPAYIYGKSVGLDWAIKELKRVLDEQQNS